MLKTNQKIKLILKMTILQRHDDLSQFCKRKCLLRYLVCIYTSNTY